MFVLMWATLVFAVKGSNADAVSFPGGKKSCQKGSYCITLSEREITAESGLCVVIPCSFTTSHYFTPQHLVWYKCEPSKQNCDDSDIIFHSNKNNKKVQSGFRGRVSLLEPDVSQRNCSVVVNDVTESDSGSYQLRVNGLQVGRDNGFTYSGRAVVSVKVGSAAVPHITDLVQKPTVMIPPLTEGQQTTLTCTAPGLCSGSEPKITWTWRGAGEKDSHITGNITAAFKTENLTAVTQRHSSTLTFNLSAEHHGTEVTCKVGFTNGITTEETLTLNVTYVKKFKFSGNTSVKEGETLNLTCSVESFPPSFITWTKLGLNKSLNNGTESATVVIPNMTAEHSGRYICTAQHLDNIMTQGVNITAIYVKKPVISGMTCVEEGDALNLTCSVESFPPSVITWTKHGSDKNLQNGNVIIPQDDAGTATLIIVNVTAEYSGQYTCTAEHQVTTLTAHTEVTVTFFPRILSSSACVVQSELLTCVCLSEGFPLPTIKWPLLENHTEYSVVTSTYVSDHTVNISITVSVKDRNYTTVECVSNNDIGEAKKTLSITRQELKQEDLLKNYLMTFKLPQVIVAFLIGILLSATVCCLARKCHRNKQRSSENMAETLEMVTTQVLPLINAGQSMENDGTHDRETPEGGVEAAGQSVPDGDVEIREAEYSDIDFSLLKRKSPTVTEDTLETTETEYAEIKNKKTEQQQDNGEEAGEVLEVSEEEEEEVMIGDDKETKRCMSAEEERGEDVAVYSNVNEIMAEI